MIPNGNSESRSRRRRRLLTILSITAFGLVCIGSFLAGLNTRGLCYEGKPIGYWEEQALSLLPQGGRDAEVDAIARKMGPEATIFWLARMQTKDSPLNRAYIRIWPALPTRLRGTLPQPIPQRKRRNVAHYVLSRMNFTNGIPELIALSYSTDSELQEYAVHLLWFRAYQVYYPSEECIAAFCHALRTGDVRTRQWAVLGLGILPLHQEALPSLQAALNDSDQVVRAKAAETIRRIRENRPALLKHD